MLDLNALNLSDLFVHLTADGSLDRLLELARDEDLSEAGDVTTKAVVDPDVRMTAHVVARSEGVAAGLAAISHVLRAFGAELLFDLYVEDGDSPSAGGCDSPRCRE
jgi:nicotinate-nucleotide pyrophosphorylase (carboxylating)